MDAVAERKSSGKEIEAWVDSTSPEESMAVADYCRSGWREELLGDFESGVFMASDMTKRFGTRDWVYWTAFSEDCERAWLFACRTDRLLAHIAGQQGEKNG